MQVRSNDLFSETTALMVLKFHMKHKEAAGLQDDENVCHTGPTVIKLFLCSTQLSMKFQMLISIKISRNSAFVRLR